MDEKKLEWGYYGVSRKIFVEALVPNMTAEFKIFTFGRRVERLQIIYDRFSDEGISRTFGYLMGWVDGIFSKVHLKLLVMQIDRCRKIHKRR